MLNLVMAKKDGRYEEGRVMWGWKVDERICERLITLQPQTSWGDERDGTANRGSGNLYQSKITLNARLEESASEQNMDLLQYPIACPLRGRYR